MNRIWQLAFGSSVMVMTLASNLSVAQSEKTITYKGDDLHYLGYVLLTGDTTAWSNMVNDDLYNLSKGLFLKNTDRLKFIENDDLYFLGAALITGKRSELDKIVTDDW